MTIMNHALAEQLEALHSDYVVAVNEAVADDDLVRVERLAADHARAAQALVRRHEGTVRLHAANPSRRGGLRRLTRRGRGSHAA
jgi:hypothetical protein